MDAQQKSDRGGIFGAIGQFAVVIAIVLLTKTVAAEAYYVPSGSMLPSLLIGDQLLVTKFPYGYSRYSLPVPLGPASTDRLLGKLPERGDVVVFRMPRDPSQTYVKRVDQTSGRPRADAGRAPLAQRQHRTVAPRGRRADGDRERRVDGAALCGRA